MSLFRVAVTSCTLVLVGCASTEHAGDDPGERWLAGDHHTHSHYSVSYDGENLPAWSIGGDGIYPIPMNALMARHHGLDWMVATDHGGPNHSKINFERAYPELQLSRSALPDVIQFYGMELNTPGADHSSIIVPHTHEEAEVLREIESRFDRHEVWAPEERRERDREAKMLEALRAMDKLDDKPVVIANHPARIAPALGEYVDLTPQELRNWNDAAPEIAVGMEGAPGHQAGPLSSNPAPRGWYFDYPTMGGFDQMTARLGGFWDSMLGEGRRWWITANSDSHRNYKEGGVAFWPGQYSKTYVYAAKNHASILEALRQGRVFVTTGDLVSEVHVSVRDPGTGSRSARIGDTLILEGPGRVEVAIRVRDPAGSNHGGYTPDVARVDLIVGDVTGPGDDPSLDVNPTTRVLKRFTAADWRRDGEVLVMKHDFTVEGPVYIRLRGTNTSEPEPAVDPADENPWTDLWFYSNPVFINITQ